ncbi:hypothetical protein JCM16418_4020 [Paenibacillus pini JCM 16418]|uniref:Uncharacterized protein n=1 Tax=Paenibacillus pini JCM 16418 TaxID=1236976 RepID=W7YYY7_9BACL|nr:hypothetical protein JCM16418_4020 [Paenibacillus pini JCM 16418]
MYSSMFIPIILINILNTKASLDLKLYQMLDQKQIISMLIWWSTLVFLGFFTCRTWLYYRRLSKFYK